MRRSLLPAGTPLFREDRAGGKEDPHQHRPLPVLRRAHRTNRISTHARMKTIHPPFKPGMQGKSALATPRSADPRLSDHSPAVIVAPTLSPAPHFIELRPHEIEAQRLEHDT